MEDEKLFDKYVTHRITILRLLCKQECKLDGLLFTYLFISQMLPPPNTLLTETSPLPHTMTLLWFHSAIMTKIGAERLGDNILEKQVIEKLN